MGFNYDELKTLTNEGFADYIRKEISIQLAVREVIAYRCRVDQHGLTDEEARETEDSPTVIVEIMTGWNGKPHAMWTYRFDTAVGEWSVSVVHHEAIERFNDLLRNVGNY